MNKWTFEDTFAAIVLVSFGGCLLGVAASSDHRQTRLIAAIPGIVLVGVPMLRLLALFCLGAFR